jgi:hypothetical protein
MYFIAAFGLLMLLFSLMMLFRPMLLPKELSTIGAISVGLSFALIYAAVEL